MSVNVWTAEECMQAAINVCDTQDPEVLLETVCRWYASGLNARLVALEQQEILEGLFDTVVACLVSQMGGEARISRACIEDPPALDEDEDFVTGEWIYTTRAGQEK